MKSQNRADCFDTSRKKHLLN